MAQYQISAIFDGRICKGAHFVADMATAEGQQAAIDAFDSYMNDSRFPAKLYKSNMAKLNELGAVAGLRACGFRIS